MYVISLSNISIKIVKINKFVQYYEGDYILCMTSRYLLSFLHQCHVTTKSPSVSLYNRSTTSFYFRTVGRTVAGNIEILKICHWKLYFAYVALYTYRISIGCALEQRKLCHEQGCIRRWGKGKGYKHVSGIIFIKKSLKIPNG